MARQFRTRSRTHLYDGGVARLYDSAGRLTGTITPTRTQTETCNDWHGSPIVDSSFNSSQFGGSYPFIDGPFKSTSSGSAQYDAFTPQALPSTFTSLTPLAAPDGWLLDLIAGTNPSRPVVNIPELIEDIVDLPKAVKGLGDLILNPGKLIKPKGLAGEYLGVQFGWLPLIDDLTKLLDFQRYAIKRNRELHQLYSGKGLRRRLKFADDTAVSTTTMSTSVGISIVTLTCSLVVKRTSWGTIHWYPTDLPPYHPDDLRWNQLSTKLVVGATPEAMLNGIWKVIPWTWLIGWFTNVGKFTLANSWTVPAQHGAGCFMSEVDAELSSAGVTATNAASAVPTHGGKATHTSKTRLVSDVVTAGVNIPYLDMFRLSILSALFVQKFSGRMSALWT